MVDFVRTTFLKRGSFLNRNQTIEKKEKRLGERKNCKLNATV